VRNYTLCGWRLHPFMGRAVDNGQGPSPLGLGRSLPIHALAGRNPCERR